MKLTLTDPKYLKESVAIISDLITEARFKVTAQSIKVVAMDPANVAMVVFEMFSSNFTEYEISEDTEFSINLSHFKQILKRAGASDTVTLELKESMVHIHLKGKYKRTFSIAIINAEEKEQKVPTLNFGVTVTAPCSILNDVVDDAAVIMADAIGFTAENKKVTFLAESDMNKVKIDVEESEDTKIIMEEKDPIKAKYSVEYLKKMVTGAKIADTVKICFNKDYPLKLEYNKVDTVQIMFILAPRVEND
ncbi:proliferating cell nuclear antigen (pcna) [Candidatus Woesearchaeota archaeon]|nr:proliferating cell nuclear antigen (pcna) [Candidatus Woesearchaeota archaeon]